MLSLQTQSDVGSASVLVEFSEVETPAVGAVEATEIGSAVDVVVLQLDWPAVLTVSAKNILF